VARVEDFPAEDPTYLNHLHVNQETILLRPGALIPLILCYRRSTMELTSRLEPYRLRAGDRVTMPGGDGYAGSYPLPLLIPEWRAQGLRGSGCGRMGTGVDGTSAHSVAEPTER
jgi:hypothetical protein